MLFTEMVGRPRRQRNTPLYIQIQFGLRQAIRSKKLVENDLIPTEKDIAKALDVSLITVRKAICGLVDEGLLHRRRGKGTFVSSHLLNNATRLLTFSDDMILRNRKPQSRWLLKAKGRIASEEVIALGLSPGTPVYQFHRQCFADDQPIALEYTTVPVHCLTSLECVGESIFAALEEQGHRPIRALQRLRAVTLTTDQAKWLGLKRGDVGLLIERRCFGADDRVMEFTRTYYRSDAYDVVTELIDHR